MKILEEIQKFEKDFIAAGELASKMHQTTDKSLKTNTGFYELDVVTAADFAVQEYILERLSHSEIIKKCELLAEEETKYTDKFSKKSKLILTIDPIDGTYLYAHGKKMWKVIIGIHDRKRPLYTFCYFPEYKWGVKIVKDRCEYIGERPQLKLKSHILPKSIAYGIYGKEVNPQKLFTSKYRELIGQGYQFVERKEISDEPSTTGQFLILSDAFDGLIMDGKMGSAVDILVGLHFGLANDYIVDNHMDLSRRNRSASAVGNYEGYYLILKNNF
jgi:fructose-1,6-bisphosphatase/inositol monophosphatase family enzyme